MVNNSDMEGDGFGSVSNIDVNRNSMFLLNINVSNNCGSSINDNNA